MEESPSLRFHAKLSLPRRKALPFESGSSFCGAKKNLAFRFWQRQTKHSAKWEEEEGKSGSNQSRAIPQKSVIRRSTLFCVKKTSLAAGWYNRKSPNYIAGETLKKFVREGMKQKRGSGGSLPSHDKSDGVLLNFCPWHSALREPPLPHQL